jgi:hypothetical protein
MKLIFLKPGNPLKLGLEKCIQNIENPEWESYKVLKILGIQSGKCPELPKPRKKSFVRVLNQSYSSSSRSVVWGARCFLSENERKFATKLLYHAFLLFALFSSTLPSSSSSSSPAYSSSSSSSAFSSVAYGGVEILKF